MSKNNRGFAALEAVLLIIAVCILAGAGWYVWHTSRNTDKTLNATTRALEIKSSSAPTIAIDKKTGDHIYTNGIAGFSVTYPADWVQPVNQRLCSGTLKRDLEIGPNAGSVAKCGGDGTVSQVSISSIAGDKQRSKDYLLPNDGSFGVLQVSSAKADSVTGTSYRGVAAGQGGGLGAYPDGAIVVLDVFYTRGTTYFARYTQYPVGNTEGPAQNQLTAFNQTVASLKFN